MNKDTIRFEDFELDRGAFELRHKGEVVRLERLPLELLFLLAERRGLLVTRDEILDQIWGKNVFVDADNGINTAVRKIRQALKETPEKPRFVQTVPGKGYRFAGAEVGAGELAQETTDPIIPLQPERDARGAMGSVFKHPGRGWWFGIGCLLVLVGFVGIRTWMGRKAMPNPGRTMLVVLPFENLSGDPTEEYFADGMTEEMITELGSLDPQHLAVIARTSSMQYKGAHKNMAQIAGELGVNYLLEGSVRRQADRVRITAQLIQASDQTHIWAASFDREQTDILRVQSEVALAIAGKIELSLPHQVRARLEREHTLDPKANEAYMLGLQADNQRTREAAERAIEEFQRATAIDPNYAQAYVALARAYSLASVTRVLPERDSMPEARRAALRAIALDDSLAGGHAVLAFVKAHYEYDWEGARREYLRALELNPNDGYAHLFYSNSYLSPLGRHEEAIAEMKKAIAIDPLSAPMQSFQIRTYMWARRYDDGIRQFKKADQMFPGFVLNHERVAHLYASIGKFDEAISEETKARLLSGEDPKAALAKESELRSAWMAEGAQGYWKKQLEFARLPENPPEAYVSTYGMAILYARLGFNERAFEWLDKAYEERNLALTEIGIEPALDPLRSDRRFADLLRRVGLARFQ